MKIPPIKRYLAIALIAYQKREINANLGGIFKPVLGEWAVKSLAPWGSERERQTGIYPAIIGGRGGIPMMRHFDAIKGLRPCMRGISFHNCGTFTDQRSYAHVCAGSVSARC